jgi:glycosyltransferase involved in cell wall biosynthesis
MNVAFLTTTMFSKANGPAVFALNLFETSLKDKKSLKTKIEFITEDSVGMEGVVLVPTFFSSFFRSIGMLLKSVEYANVLNNRQYDFYVWNFSVLAWYSLWKDNNTRKHIVFVNDPYSLNLPSKKNYKYFRLIIFKFFESYTCKQSYHIITNSIVIKKDLCEVYNISSDKISVLHKGINCEINSIPKSNWDIKIDDVIRIAFVKSDYISGGLQLLIDSLLLIPSLKFDLVVIGPEKLPEYLFGYPNIKLNHLGRLENRSSMFNEMVKCDIFCIPNIQEAFGQANCEAMLLQVPTIILPTTYQLALHDESYCWIPKSIDDYNLANIIKEIIEINNFQREAKAIKARKVVLTKYNIKFTKIEFNNILSTLHESNQ